MSRVLDSLDNLSDRVSPLVVKEVRQMVRGREFNYSFGLSLLAGLLVAFFGSADAMIGNSASGAWIFGVLIGFLTLVGLAVVPLGTFNVLRTERSERTFDLITLTTLSSRRIVIGKLLAQGVKLLTLFAGLSPFIAMSFLLGGIDFLTILISLATLFMWSLWACAACLFLSALSKSRAMSSLLFVGAAFLFLFIFGFGRSFYFMMMYGARGRGSIFPTYGSAGSDLWWTMGIMAAFCVITMTNLILLAENRLSLPTEDRVTALRIGFFVQFLFIMAWAVIPRILNPTTASRSDSLLVLGGLGGLQLAGVAFFTVTEDIMVSRRILRQNKGARWARLMAIFRPGAGRGAAYMLAQMALVLVAGWWLAAGSTDFWWLLAICCYICFYTGVPAILIRVLAPQKAKTAPLRAATLLFFPIVMLASDMVSYLSGATLAFDTTLSIYHVVNPIRALASWRLVNSDWLQVVFIQGILGAACYVAFMKMDKRMNDHAHAAD